IVSSSDGPGQHIGRYGFSALLRRWDLEAYSRRFWSESFAIMKAALLGSVTVAKTSGSYRGRALS
ncbi:hypothetical protein, partial [Streptomyces sp. NPDC007355]|uniref:hypothetical protein n=1 Tax=Streptomyces sp. NPDC007355 TaxID=3364778 RepID=UPI0036D11510